MYCVFYFVDDDSLFSFVCAFVHLVDFVAFHNFTLFALVHHFTLFALVYHFTIVSLVHHFTLVGTISFGSHRLLNKSCVK